MRIAICSNSGDCCSKLHDWLEHYAMAEKIRLRLFIYHNVENLYQYMKMGGMWNLILIDADLPDDGGIELGRTVRRHPLGEAVQLIFFSQGEDCCFRLFETEPLNWYPKPLCKEALYQDMDKITALYGGCRMILHYERDGVPDGIPLKEVKCIEALGKMLHVYTRDDGEIITRDSLNHMEERYRMYGFCRCHRSFLVNMNYVAECREHSFVLVDHREIPYGMKYMDRVAYAIHRWNKR